MSVSSPLKRVENERCTTNNALRDGLSLRASLRNTPELCRMINRDSYLRRAWQMSNTTNYGRHVSKYQFINITLFAGYVQHAAHAHTRTTQDETGKLLKLRRAYITLHINNIGTQQLNYHMHVTTRNNWSKSILLILGAVVHWLSDQRVVGLVSWEYVIFNNIMRQPL